jgi:hypothetical protein
VSFQNQKPINIVNIQKIIGEKGEMPQLCGSGSCPAAILTEGGDLFVQGYVPSENESAQLSGPAGESFVKMPREVFEKIARQVLKT